MFDAIPIRQLGRRFSWHWAFIGGLVLSGIAVVTLLSVIYFAGTAPRLPPSAAALERLKPSGGSWQEPLDTKPLDRAPVQIVPPPPTSPMPPRWTATSEAPPIDVTDLPPPERAR